MAQIVIKPKWRTRVNAGKVHENVRKFEAEGWKQTGKKKNGCPVVEREILSSNGKNVVGRMEAYVDETLTSEGFQRAREYGKSEVFDPTSSKP
jgi:hypothetical protein